MNFRRAIPVVLVPLLVALGGSSAWAQPAPEPAAPATTATQTPTSPPSTDTPVSKGEDPVIPDIPVIPDVPAVFQIPPAVDREIAAVLENERRVAAVEEAKAAAAAEQAAVDAIAESIRVELEAAQQELDAANAVVEDAASALDETRRALEQASRRIDNRRDRATEVGVEMYTATGSERDPRTSFTIALLANKDVPDASTAKAYRDVVANAAFGGLRDARVAEARVRNDLERAQVRLDEATAAKDVQQQAKLVVEDRLAEAMNNSATVRSSGSKRVAAAAAEAPTLKSTDLSGGLTIMGDPLVSAVDLAAFVRRTGKAHPSVDVEALAESFIAEGRAEGVRSDVAWVQSIIETGWFSFAGSMVKPGDFNYAGIGACDSCSRGIIFKDMNSGVRSQVQLLRTYATKGLKTSDLANPPPRLAPERSFVRGCCGTWMKLSGVWATGPGYGIKILTLYNQLLSFAASRRAG